MTRFLTTTALILTLGAGAAFASSDDYGITAEKAEQIKLRLTEQGYDVRKIDSEDGMIEVYALKDGQRLELYLDADLNIVKTKIDD